jgi:dephospho-CoA kinase
MLRIGLTGGIGSGKSTVAKIFEVLDIPVYYADDVTRKLMNEDEAIIKNIKEHFGELSYIDGKLNRAHIASIVFSDKAKLATLNAITHPPTIQHAAEWMQQQTTPYVIKEAALIFESGSYKDLDYVIGVFSPKQLRINRVMERDGVSSNEVVKRMNQQMDEDEKMQRCDFVITNDEQQLVVPQVMELHAKLLKMNARPARRK